VLSSLKRTFLAGAVALSGVLSVAPFAAHAAGPPSLTVNVPAAGSIAIGQTFPVTIDLNSNSTPITGWQFGFTYDPALVELDNGSGVAVAVAGNLPMAYTYGAAPADWLDTFAGTSGGAAGGVAMKLTALGTVQFGGQSLSGQAAGTGSNGNSPPHLANFQFKALANGVSPFTLANLKVTDVNAAAIAGVTVTPTSPSMTVGPVNAANLVIANATTVSPTTPAGNTFNVTFSVNNTGTLASAAGSATVSITGATPATATVPVPAVAAGGTSGTLTTVANGGPFTLSSGSTLANVTITDGTASATTAYSFAAYTATGNTQVDGNIAAILQLTPPSDVTNFVLTPNVNNAVTTTTPLVIKSNLTSFSVTVSGTNNGFLSEYNAGAYVTGGKVLHNPLQVKGIAVPAAGNTSQATFQNITGTPTSYVSGQLAGQDPANGAQWTTSFNQFVGFNDPSVAAPHTYHETVTFAAAGTF
jgi:hypothetical protein